MQDISAGIKLTVYLPGPKAAWEHTVIDSWEHQLKEVAGGFTRWRGAGFWRSPTTGDCMEGVQVYVIYVERREQSDLLTSLLKGVRVALKQEVVLFEEHVCTLVRLS